MTIDDPDVYERAWTVSVPLMRNDSYQLFEYACHEGNQAMELMLGGARAQERQAAEAAKNVISPTRDSRVASPRASPSAQRDQARARPVVSGIQYQVIAAKRNAAPVSPNASPNP